MNDEDDAIRVAILNAVMRRRLCDQDEAETILHRIAARLDGCTHAEAVERYPLPPGRDEACGTA